MGALGTSVILGQILLAVMAGSMVRDPLGVAIYCYIVQGGYGLKGFRLCPLSVSPCQGGGPPPTRGAQYLHIYFWKHTTGYQDDQNSLVGDQISSGEWTSWQFYVTFLGHAWLQTASNPLPHTGILKSDTRHGEWPVQLGVSVAIWKCIHVEWWISGIYISRAKTVQKMNPSLVLLYLIALLMAKAAECKSNPGPMPPPHWAPCSKTTQMQEALYTHVVYVD